MDRRAHRDPETWKRPPETRADSAGGRLQDRDIILIASAPWRMAGKLNCHHIAERLARANRVLYVESVGLRTPSLFHAADLRKTFARLRSWAGASLRPPRAVAPRLHVISPLAPPLGGRAILAELQGGALVRASTRAAIQLGYRDPILWTFLPIGARLLGRLGEAAAIYHCVDAYAGNPGVPADVIARDEERLVAAADLCIATSRPLAQRLAEVGARVHCAPNAAEVGRFARAHAVPADLARLPRPLIGYVGNVASYKVDIELLAELARRRPAWSLVLVGPHGIGDPGTDLRALRERPNVHLLGAREHGEIPGYVQGLDVCLIPFRRSPVTECSLPLKTFEYLAAGKPVVCRPTGALTAEPIADVVAWADSVEEFETAIATALAESGQDLAEARRRRAAEYDWEPRFQQIERAVGAALERRSTCSKLP